MPSSSLSCWLCSSSSTWSPSPSPSSLAAAASLLPSLHTQSQSFVFFQDSKSRWKHFSQILNMTIPILAWFHLWTYIERRGRQRCYCWNPQSWKHGRSRDLGGRNDDTIYHIEYFCFKSGGASVLFHKKLLFYFSFSTLIRSSSKTFGVSA